jgi:hypothetical protein
VLEQLQPCLAQLQKLLVEVNPQANQFRKDIRKYNRTLAFTLISYNRDNRLTGQGSIQCFQIHGELFHFKILYGPRIVLTLLLLSFSFTIQSSRQIYE